MQVRGLVKTYGAHRAVDGIDLDVGRARSSPCSDRTAPARPRRSRSWRATGGGPRATSGCSARTPPRPTGPGGRGSVSSCSPPATPASSRSASSSTTSPASAPPARPGGGHRRCRADREGRRPRRLAVGWPAAPARRRPRHRRQPRAALPRRAHHRLRPPGPPLVLGPARVAAPEGTTIMLTTHYLDEAEHLADRVGVIARGRLVDVAAAERLGGAERGRPLVRWREGGSVRAAAPTTHRAGAVARRPPRRRGAGAGGPAAPARGRLPVDDRGRRRLSQQAPGRRRGGHIVTTANGAVAKPRSVPALRSPEPTSSCWSSSGSARRWSSSSPSRSDAADLLVGLRHVPTSPRRGPASRPRSTT